MNESHAISALVRKRAELSGELVAIDKRRREVQSRIGHVDSVLKMFGYRENPADIAPRARYTRAFKRGELSRMIADYLRVNGGAMTNKEIAMHVMRSKSWDATDEELIPRITASVKVTRRAIEQRLQERAV